MPGGGVRADNALELIRATGCKEIHLGPRLPAHVDTKVPARGVRINKSAPPDDAAWTRLDAESVHAAVLAVTTTPRAKTLGARQ